MSEFLDKGRNPADMAGFSAEKELQETRDKNLTILGVLCLASAGFVVAATYVVIRAAGWV